MFNPMPSTCPGARSTEGSTPPPKTRSSSGIVAITGNKLPGPVPRASGDPYEFFTADDPNPPEDPDNDAHCEVRVKPQGRPFTKNHKMNKEVRAKAQDALARCLRIVKMPEWLIPDR